MLLAKSDPCLLCSLRQAAQIARPQHRNFAAQTRLRAKVQNSRKSPWPSIKAADLVQTSSKEPLDVRLAQMKFAHPSKRQNSNVEATTRQDTLQRESAQARFASLKPYTAREKQLLALKYTPAQLHAIEAGEAAIDPLDVATQGKWRPDPLRLEYKDDFSRILPVVDHPARHLDSDIDPDIRALTKEETDLKFAEFMRRMAAKLQEHEARVGQYRNDQERQDDISRVMTEANIHPFDGRTPQQRMQKWKEVAEYVEGPSFSAGWEAFTSDPTNFDFSPKGKLHAQSSVLSQDLPRFNDPEWTYADATQDVQMERLMRRTGLSMQAIRRLRTAVLVFHPVTNQTHMGKIMHFYTLAAVGNEDGMLGLGEGNAVESGDSRKQAINAAILNMKPIPRYEKRTIFGDIEGKVCASVVQLSARPPGMYCWLMPCRGILTKSRFRQPVPIAHF